MKNKHMMPMFWKASARGRAKMKRMYAGRNTKAWKRYKKLRKQWIIDHRTGGMYRNTHYEPKVYKVGIFE